MKNLFNSVKMTKPNTNLFDLTHDVKLSFNMGELIPVMTMECVPGDKVTIEAESILRFAPMVAPVMHRYDVTMHYFFVPNRIIWPNWEKFITNTPLDGSDVLPAFPTVVVNSLTFTRLCDYLGVPNVQGPPGSSETISALPFAAYQAIWNEYYRDQNLIDPIDFKLMDGANTLDEFGILRRRAWEHDYFTAALPFAQKGEAVDIPLGKVELDPNAAGTPGQVRDYLTQSLVPDGDLTTASGDLASTGSGTDAVYDPNGTLNVEPTTINDLRRAFRLQEWLEKAARGGSRYIENILVHFGVKSSDKRLQRPEYITGTKSPVQISEILNTTGTEDLPQGNMAGHGISVTGGRAGSYYCEEHGYIIGLMSVMPKTAYQQGIPKHFLKTEDPFQYYWPTFAHIGEQEVLNKELYAFTPTGNETFGYVPRYAEYKFMPSRVCGDFRTTLDFWHNGRIFETQPALNQEFVECNPDTRVFAVEDPDVQKMYAHVLNKVVAVRKMPKFGTPTF